MAFDGIVTKAIVSEISELCNSRIDKVFQPDKNSIVLGLYQNGLNYALNICIDAQNCRLNLTTHPKANPQVAPNFCMLLRKNLIGLRLKNIYSLDLERLIVIELEGFDDVDDIISKKLIIELMGRHSNIILLDENSIIVDSLRHIKEIDENYRDILPHTKYVFPTSNKNNFLDLKSFDEFFNILNFDSYNLEDTKMQNNTSFQKFIKIQGSAKIDKNLPLEISNKFNGISKNFVSFVTTKVDSLEDIFNYINQYFE